MTDNYETIVADNLVRLYENLPPDLAELLPAEKDGNAFAFEAFGANCRITPDGIRFHDDDHPPVMGIIISLYALYARPENCVLLPFQAFREFPNTMPYVGAFATHTEKILEPHTTAVKNNLARIRTVMKGRDAPPDMPGDFAFVVWPLPKIALCYIFYEADDDFPASATCLYSHNADRFLPIDALADVGEYTSRRIISIAG
jgi:hypothetical protein